MKTIRYINLPVQSDYICVKIYLLAGSCFGRDIAHLVEHFIINQSHTDNIIIQQGITHNDYVAYDLLFSKKEFIEKLPIALKCLLGQQIFNEAILNKEKNAVEIENMWDYEQTAAKVYELIAKKRFIEPSPYFQMRSINLDYIDYNQVLEFYKKYYRINNALIVLGAYNWDEKLKHFADKSISEISDVIKETAVLPPQPKYSSLMLVKKNIDTLLIDINFCWPSSNKDVSLNEKISLIILQRYFNSLDSPLLRKLRFEKGLIYNFNKPAVFMLRRMGLFILEFPTKRKDVSECLRETLKEINSMKKVNIDTDLLEEIKKNYAYEMLGWKANRDLFFNSTADEYYNWGNYNEDEYVKQIWSINGDSIRAIANKIFNHDFLNVYLLGEDAENLDINEADIKKWSKIE